MAGNVKNLKPYKKGESGNLNGRPRKLPELDKLLADVLGGDPDDPDAKSEAKEVLAKLVQKAKSGNVQAQIAVLDRAYGKPKQAVEHSGAGGGAVDVNLNTSALTTDEKRALLELLTKAQK